MGFSHRSYLLASVNFYIFLLSLSAYINKPKAFTNTHLPASKKFDKVLILSFSRYSERRKRVVSSLSRLSENPGEITLSAAAVQQRVITNSNGCFYINGRLWRPLNEEIAGVKHLWKCHLRKRKGGERKRRRRESGRRGRFFFLSWQISAGQCCATVYLGPVVVFWELAVQGSVWISRVRRGSLNKLAPGQHPRRRVLINVCQIWKTWHVWWKADWDTKGGERENKRAAENRMYRGIKYWKWNKRRRQQKKRRRKRRGGVDAKYSEGSSGRKREMKNKGREAMKERSKQGTRGRKGSKAKDKQTGRERETEVLFLHLSKAAGV